MQGFAVLIVGDCDGGKHLIWLKALQLVTKGNAMFITHYKMELLEQTACFSETLAARASDVKFDLQVALQNRLESPQ